MQTLILKESQAPYQVILEEPPAPGDVVVLEKNGQPVAAVVPMTEYLEFQSWRAIEQRKRNQQLEEAAIAREHRAFQQLLPQLLQQYPGRVVAIHDGKVIAVGDDRMEVWQRARQQMGNAPVDVQTVEAHPKVYKVTGRKVVHHVGI
ncbi:MAG: DUF5678 domain-containing protein [Caldilineaceae bacterium]